MRQVDSSDLREFLDSSGLNVEESVCLVGFGILDFVLGFGFWIFPMATSLFCFGYGYYFSASDRPYQEQLHAKA